MDGNWVYRYIPKIFGGLAFLVNPIFVYLVFSEKNSKLGNYRFLLLYFAIFNLIYSVANIAIPMDIHIYRYCFFLVLSDGWFVENSEMNFHMLAGRCSLVCASYAVLLSHLVYRYLVIQNSSLTRKHFRYYMTGSFAVFALYFLSWHAICYIPGRANVEMRKYIRKDFQEMYGMDSMDFNMLGALFQEASEETTMRSWTAVILWSSISTVSMIMFFILAKLIIKKLNKTTNSMSQKTSKLQKELLRALIVQTVVPIVVSFTPCLLCWYSPMFGIQLARGFNYFEVSALGAFAFVDPIAIVMCLPVFRQRIFCQSGLEPSADSSSKRKKKTSSTT